MISHNPDGTPFTTQELLQLAAESGKKVIQVIIDPEGAKVGDTEGLSFLALVDFLPGIGETILTQNKKQCTVTKVFHKVIAYAPKGQTEAFLMIPNVYATITNAEAERV